MCNIAGYIGGHRAAPILIDMMRRQDGFGGGYYTGLATIHEGKLYSAKVVGGIDKLLRETNALDLPGTVGIIHSRSNSGGDVEWGHPFLSNDGNMAMVVNGHRGLICTREQQNAAVQSLDEDGYHFRSRVPQTIGDYPIFADGSCAHVSEALTLMTERHHKNGKSPEEAMAATYCELPDQIVGLAVFADEPDAIIVARRDQPMMIGRTADATYLATTAIAFPAEEQYVGIDPIPVASSGTIRRDSRVFHSFPPAKIPVGEITSDIICKARAMLLDSLEKQNGEPASIMKLMPTLGDLFPTGTLPQKWMLGYEALRPLLADGTVEIVPYPHQGAFEGIEAVSFWVRLAKK